LTRCDSEFIAINLTLSCCSVEGSLQRGDVDDGGNGGSYAGDGGARYRQGRRLDVEDPEPWIGGGGDGLEEVD